MKKALIDENSIVAQVADQTFDVVSPCFWVDCADNVIPYAYKYENGVIVLIPVSPPTAKDNEDAAKKKLQDSDWAVLPDVNLQNKADWETFRSALRAIARNPQSGYVTWPVRPQEIWN